MHESSVKHIVEWYAANYDRIPSPEAKIAEVGSYDINGSVKDFLPVSIVGFDICEGPKVDVVIEPGKVPPEHVGIYDAVISANAFHLCGDAKAYKDEVVALLKEGGLFILTMCRPDCDQSHRTSPNRYGFKDGIRHTPEQAKAFWSHEISPKRVFIEGHDLVYWGEKA